MADYMIIDQASRRRSREDGSDDGGLAVERPNKRRCLRASPPSSSALFFNRRNSRLLIVDRQRLIEMSKASNGKPLKFNSISHARRALKSPKKFSEAEIYSQQIRRFRRKESLEISLVGTFVPPTDIPVAKIGTNQVLLNQKQEGDPTSLKQMKSPPMALPLLSKALSFSVFSRSKNRVSRRETTSHPKPVQADAATMPKPTKPQAPPLLQQVGGRSFNAISSLHSLGLQRSRPLLWFQSCFGPYSPG